MWFRPFPGGPSEKVGLLAGDRILSANDTIISGVKKKNTDIQKILRGPKGSVVNVNVLRKGAKGPIEFRIVRDDIPIASVDASFMAAPGVGYIRVSRFGESTFDEVRKALAELAGKGMRDVIVDLEDNGGGYLKAAYDLAGLFLDAGDTVVFTKRCARGAVLLPHSCRRPHEPWTRGGDGEPVLGFGKRDSRGSHAG